MATAALVASCFAAAALVISGHGTSRPAPDYRMPAARASMGSSPGIAVPFVSAYQLRRLPASTTDTTIPNAPLDRYRRDGTSGAVVHNGQQIPVFTTPGGTAFARLPPQQLGADTWLPVIGRQAGWVQVLLPSRPNGSAGWLDASRVAVAHSSDQVWVHLGSERLQLVRSGRVAGSWRVSTGTARTPTPAGRTFLLAQIQDPRQPFSPLILTLGTHSSALDSYAGGPGTVGIHMWPTEGGSRASHGCIRVPAAALRALRQVPLGSLVRVDQQ